MTHVFSPHPSAAGNGDLNLDSISERRNRRLELAAARRQEAANAVQFWGARSETSLESKEETIRRALNTACVTGVFHSPMTLTETERQKQRRRQEMATRRFEQQLQQMQKTTTKKKMRAAGQEGRRGQSDSAASSVNDGAASSTTSHNGVVLHHTAVEIAAPIARPSTASIPQPFFQPRQIVLGAQLGGGGRLSKAAIAHATLATNAAQVSRAAGQPRPASALDSFHAPLYSSFSTDNIFRPHGEKGRLESLVAKQNSQQQASISMVRSSSAASHGSALAQLSELEAALGCTLDDLRRASATPRTANRRHSATTTPPQSEMGVVPTRLAGSRPASTGVSRTAPCAASPRLLQTPSLYRTVDPGAAVGVYVTPASIAAIRLGDSAAPSADANAPYQLQFVSPHGPTNAPHPPHRRASAAAFSSIDTVVSSPPAHPEDPARVAFDEHHVSTEESAVLPLTPQSKPSACFTPVDDAQQHGTGDRGGKGDLGLIGPAPLIPVPPKTPHRNTPAAAALSNPGGSSRRGPRRADVTVVVSPPRQANSGVVTSLEDALRNHHVAT